MGKADDSRRTKKISSKKGKKLGESNKWKQHKRQWSNDKSKKPATLKKKDSLSKNKANAVYCEFNYDFGRFSMDFEEKQAKRGQFYCIKTG